MLKDKDFCRSEEIYVTNMENKYQILIKKPRITRFKNSDQKAAQKATEATGEFIENKIADKIVKTKPMLDENSRNVEEIIIPPDKREEIIKKFRRVL